MPVVHRDVKPTNIMLAEDGTPKLTDFDLAMSADTTGGTDTRALGTFAYAAPEALQNASVVDTAADVYGLAMTAVRCLLARSPTYNDKSNTGRLVRQLPVSAAVRTVLKSSLQTDSSKRPRDAEVFLRRLREARKGVALWDFDARSLLRALLLLFALGTIAGLSVAVIGVGGPVDTMVKIPAASSLWAATRR